MLVEELWYKKLGYYNNPFSIKPAPFTNEIIGYNLKDIFNKIDKGKIFFVEGAYGVGKTTLLKHIIHRYGGHRKVIYYSCSLERKMGVRDLIIGSGSFFQRTLGIKKHDLIFLVDEAQDLQLADSNELFQAYRHGYLKSIVFVGVKINKNSMVQEIEKLLEGNIINLPAISQENAVDMVKKRLGDLNLLPPDVIREIYLRSGKNPRMLLEQCEDLCRETVSRGISKIKKKDIELIPGLLSKPRVVKKRKKARKLKEDRLDEVIEEAVMETEADLPVVETLHEFRQDETLPPFKKRKK